MQKPQVEPHLSRYLHGRGARLGIPVAGNFELTARCNFRCPMCYVHQDGQQERELTTDQWISLAKAAADRGMVFALLTGGEPFLRKDFFEIYDAMCAMGLMVSINSNGSMLLGEILGRLLEAPPFRINISLYGGCRETYQEMCGRDAFEGVVDSIRTLKERGVDVSLNLSITPWNCGDLERIEAIAREIGVPVRATTYMYPPARLDGAGSRRLTALEAARYKVEWDLLSLEKQAFLNRAERMKALSCAEQKSCAVDLDAGVGCRAGGTSFWLTWDGRMLPCGMMPYPAVSALELGFDAAWEEIRARTRGIRAPAACASCEKRDICSVCAAVRVAETGSFDQVPKYVCELTEQTLAAMWAAYETQKGEDT